MPTIPERLSSLEVRMSHVEVTTSEIRDDVKELLAWRDEERGARKSRATSLRWMVTGFTALSGIVSAIVGAVVSQI
jgi:hypothetical protein